MFMKNDRFFSGVRNDDDYYQDGDSAARAPQGTLWDFMEKKFPIKGGRMRFLAHVLYIYEQGLLYMKVYKGD